MSDEVPYQEKLKAYAAYKHENDPDYYDSRGRFIANAKFEDGEWWPIAAIEPDRARVERWYALTYGKRMEESS